MVGNDKAHPAKSGNYIALAAATPTSQPVRAAIWMVGAIVSFTVMAIAGRAVSTQLDTFEIMMYRSLVGLAMVLIFAGSTGQFGQITTRSLHLHFIRNLSHFAGQNLWLFAITVAPLAQVFALEFTAPIWALFLAVFILNENLTKTRVLAAMLGFCGVLLVTQPWQAQLAPGIIPAAIAAIGFAGSAVFTRLLTRTETILCILFWLTFMQAVFGLAFAGYDGAITLPDATGAIWVGLIGVAGLVAHFCLTTALSLAPAAVVLPVDFTRLPVIAVIGLLFYNEPLSILVILGAAIIFAANYVNVLAESKTARKTQQIR